MDIDWIGDWRLVLNVLLSSILLGGLGVFLSMLATLPPGTKIWSLSILLPSIVATYAAFHQRLLKPPTDVHLANRIKNGQAPDRRKKDEENSINSIP